MQNYNIDAYDYRLEGSSTIRLYDNKRFVAEITFRLEQRVLWISNLFRTEYGKKFGKAGRHYGTEIFAILLLHLLRSGEPFDYIVGRLSFHDAEQDFWLTSIPYYARFEQFVPTEVGYRLKFYLFDSKDAMHDKKAVKLPDYKERERFRSFVNDFQQEHILQSKDAYFCYVVDRAHLQ